ncbi:hypothetical protein MFUL124B02_35515 [Myxococcus fulvus 124B02]|nr:hypothetical protein MFUL124B02_35515 [Myxococcus fulvus 124B02]
MLKKLLVGLAAALLILVGLIASRPAEFTIQRTATLPGPTDVAFAQVNDFHQWNAWSPWAALDPDMKTTYSGPPSGVGAGYAWTGNEQVGEGRMTIEESRAPEHVRVKLEFIKPWAATNLTDFHFKPVAGGTEVTWAMSGTNDFMGKAFGLLMDMDAMVGKDFEKGLASLKGVVEAEVKKRAQAEAARVAAAKAAEEQAAAEAAAAAPVVAQPTP